MRKDVPTGENGKPIIIPRVGVDDEGLLFLYDAVTGREFGHQSSVRVEVVDSVDDLQQVTVTLQSDPRLYRDEALERARNGEGGWAAEEYHDRHSK